MGSFNAKVLSLNAARYYVHLALVDNNIQRFDVFWASSLAHHVVNKFVNGVVLFLCWEPKVLKPTIGVQDCNFDPNVSRIHAKIVSWALTSTPTCNKKSTGHKWNLSLWLPDVKVICECTPLCTQRRHQMGTCTTRPVPRACRWRDFLPKFTQPNR